MAGDPAQLSPADEASFMASARSSSSFLNGVSHGTSSAASKTENDTNSSSSSARAPMKEEKTKDHGAYFGSAKDPRFRGPSGMLYAAPDLQLRYRLTQQIDYYFSDNNLSTDEFLRKQMDEQGWVSLYLIADFKRVKILTNNIIFISDAVRASTVVELEGSKIRRRNDWMRWPSLRSLATPSTTGPLTNSLAAMALDEGQPNGHHSPVRSSLGG
ncbi:unnamed protein product [Spirodela intermedia]|uniref:HTH La-type RNA-binding domain-containing protein n=1 Tax=Spirodela intermedia TaxID=51605 RepID=A0A7I8LL07_SPIIN|nr:unnamed protein product [Spirodela intermedia]